MVKPSASHSTDPLPRDSPNRLMIPIRTTQHCPLLVGLLALLSLYGTLHAEPVKVAFVGDSLTVHYTQAKQSVADTPVFHATPDTPLGQTIARHGGTWQAVVIAAHGLTAPAWPHRDGDWNPDPDGFNRLDLLLNEQPDLVVLMLGTNDALHIGRYADQTAPREQAYRAALARLLDVLHADTSVLLLTLPPVIEATPANTETDIAAVNRSLDRFNQHLQQLADQRNRTALFDYRAWVTSLDSWPAYYNDDGVHFWGNRNNIWGNVIARDRIVRAVDTHLKTRQPSRTSPDRPEPRAPTGS
ncbi:MAG: SGNH/GDSL hydrolase family protein [Planctomycetota bacterium]